MTWDEDRDAYARETVGDNPPPLTEGQRAAIRAVWQPAVAALAEE